MASEQTEALGIAFRRTLDDVCVDHGLETHDGSIEWVRQVDDDLIERLVTLAQTAIERAQEEGRKQGHEEAARAIYPPSEEARKFSEGMRAMRDKITTLETALAEERARGAVVREKAQFIVDLATAGHTLSELHAAADDLESALDQESPAVTALLELAEAAEEARSLGGMTDRLYAAVDRRQEVKNG